MMLPPSSILIVSPAFFFAGTVIVKRSVTSPCDAALPAAAAAQSLRVLVPRCTACSLVAAMSSLAAPSAAESAALFTIAGGSAMAIGHRHRTPTTVTSD